MAGKKQPNRTRGSAFRAGPPRERTPLRDNLEYFAALLLVVLLLRQVVVEAFRIQHGSMAPTLAGVHNEVRCSNCGWAFNVGWDKVGLSGEVECPNCRYSWQGVSRTGAGGGRIVLKQPGWLWNAGRLADGAPLSTTEAANRVARRASRIFVNKFIYKFRKPRRWEVVVFLYPSYSLTCQLCGWRGTVQSLDGAICPDCGETEFDVITKNFIKRVVGLPGEKVVLSNGDVYVNDRVARKPRRLQEGLWLHVFDSALMPEREVMPTWHVGEAPLLWHRSPDGGVLLLDARGAREPVMAAFGRRVVDFYPYDGPSYQSSPETMGASGRSEVGDRRIRARVRVLDHGAEGGEIVLAVDDAGKEFAFALGAGAKAGATLSVDGSPVRQTTVPGLKDNSSHWLALENYDGRLVARLDGRELLSYEYEPGPGRHGVRFGASGAQVLWERIIIERDVYYTHTYGAAGLPYRNSAAYELGDQEYFVLGDNSPASSDSRRWDEPGVPVENIVGRAFFVFWPVHQMKRLPAGEGAGEPAAGSPAAGSPAAGSPAAGSPAAD